MPRSVEQLVNHQILRWLTEQAAKDQPPQSRVRELQRPMITISREFGALGGDVGRRTAELLQIGFWSQEIVHEVARRKDVRRQVVESLDERTQTGVQHFVDNLLRVRGFSSSDYVRALTETIVSISRSRSGVVVGRGGHLFLVPNRTLRVRCFSTPEARARHVAQRDGVSLDEAALKMARVDHERRIFHEQNFRHDVTDPMHFDLLLNTSTLSVDDCAAAIAGVFRARFGEQE